MATDRPDFVESSNVVGKGRLQVETSALYERDRSAASRDRALSTPTLLRYGAGDTWELRVETDGRTSARSTDLGSGVRTSTSGFADTSVGVKWHVQDEEGGAPSVGMLLHADLASGSRELRGSGVRPSLRLVAEWELPHDMGLGVMPGVGVERNEQDKRYQYGILGVVLGKSLTDRTRGFVELSLPHIARGANGGTVATFDVGMAHLINNKLQVDAMLVRGLNRNTPDWGFTVGLSFKL